jgi:DNA-binding MarR family transcriptional regulator
VRPVLDGIRRLVQSLRLSAREAQSRAGISGAQLFVLQKLAEADAQSVNDLAARTATDQSSVSVVVHRLAGAGLVSRHPDVRDRRRVRLTLTARGRALLRRFPDSAQRRLVRAIESLAPAERRAFAASLARIVSGMGKAAPSLFFENEAGARDRSRRG